MKKIILSAIALVGTLTLNAQEDAPSFSLSGTVDAYYRANLSAPNDEDAIAPGSSFAQLPGFALGMANVIASYEGEKVGFVADLAFGPRGTDAIFASPMYSNTGDIVNQLYVYWNVSESVTLTMGNFNTFLGYEVISPAANFNYSTSYLFSYGPFSHTGLKADFDLGNDWSLMAAVMNPTDATEYNPSGDYGFGLQLGYAGQYLNFLDSQGAYEIDFTGGLDLSDSFFLGLNAAYFDGGDDVSEFGAIGATDADGDADVLALTLTGSYTVGNLMIKPELRLDSASDEAFLDNDLSGSKSLSSFVLAAVYSF